DKCPARLGHSPAIRLRVLCARGVPGQIASPSQAASRTSQFFLASSTKPFMNFSHQVNSRARAVTSVADVAARVTRQKRARIGNVMTLGLGLIELAQRAASPHPAYTVQLRTVLPRQRRRNPRMYLNEP